MADPKYENLPGIARDQPDTYETSDVPEPKEQEQDHVEESDSVETLHLNVLDAFSKFKGLSSAGPVGSKARSGIEYELVSPEEKATPMQRYQRLRLETNELLAELNQMKASDEAENASRCSLIGQVQTLLSEVETLQIEKCMGSYFAEKFTRPGETSIQKLTSLLSEHRKKRGESSQATPSTTVEKEVGQVKIRLMTSGDANLETMERIHNLESRINVLHELLSSDQPELKRVGLGNKSLLNLARRLRGKAAILDPAQLDAADARVTSLLAKLDQLSERQAASKISPENVAKINALYELTKSSEALLQITPRVIERLVTLESLHIQAAEFANSLNQLDSLMNSLNENVSSNSESLRCLEESTIKNFEILKNNLIAFEERMHNLQSRKK